MELELKMNEAAREFLHDALYEICQRIEKCGASVELTNAVMLASDLLQAIGNRHNPPNEYAAQRVLEALQAATRGNK